PVASRIAIGVEVSALAVCEPDGGILDAVALLVVVAVAQELPISGAALRACTAGGRAGSRSATGRSGVERCGGSDLRCPGHHRDGSADGECGCDEPSASEHSSPE